MFNNICNWGQTSSMENRWNSVNMHKLHPLKNNKQEERNFGSPNCSHANGFRSLKKDIKKTNEFII